MALAAACTVPEVQDTATDAGGGDYDSSWGGARDGSNQGGTMATGGASSSGGSAGSSGAGGAAGTGGLGATGGASAAAGNAGGGRPSGGQGGQSGGGESARAGSSQGGDMSGGGSGATSAGAGMAGVAGARGGAAGGTVAGGPASGGALAGAGGAIAAGGQGGFVVAGSGGSAVGGSDGGLGGGGGPVGGKGTGGLGGVGGTSGMGGLGGSDSGGTGGLSNTGGGGAAAGSCGSEYVFCDDFEDGSASDWTRTGGTWAVALDGTNRVYQGGIGSQEATANATAGLLDESVEVEIKVIAFGGSGSSYRVGVVARYASSSNFYTFSIDAAGDLHLYKSTSLPGGAIGTCGTLASGVDPKTWNTYAISVQGAPGNLRITTYLNGVLKHDCTTTASGTPASGPIGVLTYGTGTVALFDNVRVSSP